MATTVYATREDLVARFGEDEVALLEQISGEAVDKALKDATEEAESYVSVYYSPPLPSVPAPLVSAVCDIARFKLYKDRPTDDVKYRYEQAIKWLIRLADGKVKLTFDPALTPGEVEDVVTSPHIAVVGTASGGIFSDAVFSAMPVSDWETYPKPRGPF